LRATQLRLDERAAARRKTSQHVTKSSSQLKTGLRLQQRQQALAIMLMALLDFTHHF
jgi:hypothetical protein